MVSIKKAFAYANAFLFIVILDHQVRFINKNVTTKITLMVKNLLVF